ncbi:T-complex protein 1 subunit beta [Diplonema papillatum]|nr:T-complex protein 1 subunit beta [Diplonema papillatum]
MQEARYNPNLNILKAGASEMKGEECRLSNFVGAIALSDLVKTTLGPKGMDKILQSSTRSGSGVNVTNDGATILKSIAVDNPAAKILIDISKTQDDEVGDGTTSVCVLAGELLRQAEKLILIEQVHPQTIIDGWREALVIARTALEKSAVNNWSNQEKFRNDLINIASTTLSSKVVSMDKEHFANLAVDAVLRIGDLLVKEVNEGNRKRPRNLELISVMKKLGGTMHDSYLEEGFLLDKKIGVGQPRFMKDAKILVANTSMDTDKIKIFGARVKVDNMDAVVNIEKAEKEKMKAKVDKILAFGCNVFINRQLIYNYPEELFANNGVMAIEHADFDGIERLAFALGGEVVSQFDDTEGVKMGGAALIDEVMIGEDLVIRFSGVKGGRACTVVLRGSSQQLLDEAERSLRDALCIVASTVRDNRVVFGAGASEAFMAAAIMKAAKSARTVEDLQSAESRSFGKVKAMEAFAQALLQIPLIIGESAGMPAQYAHDLGELHMRELEKNPDGACRTGIDINKKCFFNTQEAGIIESFLSKSSSLEYAAEAAEMILRVDDIIRCAPRQRR